MRKIRRNQRRKQREFVQAVKSQRPAINTDKLLGDFEVIIRDGSAAMVRLAMRSVAFVSAAAYAAETLNNQLNASDMTFDTAEITRFARKIIRLNILRRMLVLFRVPKQLRTQVVNLQIAKDFGNQQSPNQLPVIRPPANPIVHRDKPHGTPPRENPFTPPRRPRSVSR